MALLLHEKWADARGWQLGRWCGFLLGITLYFGQKEVALRTVGEIMVHVTTHQTGLDGLSCVDSRKDGDGSEDLSW